ncbi:MAG: DNA polymerase IV [Bdellovibrionota bacterium]
MQKTIWHVDLDSFFVSAERLRKPSLRNKCVAVGGTGPRSVIASCSYEARRYGVRSAMPTAQALRLCPQLILCEPDHQYYSELSDKVFALLDHYTPVFEIVSIDEAYLDMTGTESLFGPPSTAAQNLRREIETKTGLTSSIGIGSNRLVAKIAGDHCKPNGLLEIAPGSEGSFLAPLSIAKLPGCGKVTQKWLVERGIKTLEQLQRYPIDVLERHLGKFGDYLHRAAWGEGSTDFHREAKSRSISRETTFSVDVSNPEILKKCLSEMAEELGRNLRESNEATRTIRLKLRYPPFQTITRHRTFERPTQLDEAIYEAGLSLLEHSWDPHQPLRLIGLGCVLSSREPEQLDLFSDSSKDETKVKLAEIRDLLRQRFGERIIKNTRNIK